MSDERPWQGNADNGIDQRIPDFFNRDGSNSDESFRAQTRHFFDSFKKVIAQRLVIVEHAYPVRLGKPYGLLGDLLHLTLREALDQRDVFLCNA
jgi:hypothetical protein